MTPKLFRQACSRFASGVTVVTTCAPDGAPHGLTVTAFSALSLDPPLVMVAIDRSSGILPVFETSGHYAVNILREDQRDLSVRFSELPEGRFTNIAWGHAPTTGAPMLKGVLGVLECRTVQVVDAGDHRILIGDVVKTSVGEGRPLVYFHRGYNSLA